MKKMLICAATLAVALPAAHAADVGVSISIAEPGVYGRLDIGRFPQPVLVAPTPVIVQRQVVREPVYLWVPPGQRQNWRQYCGRYNACGAPVYFVQDGWYHQHVAPVAYRPAPVIGHRHDRDDHPGRGHGHGKGHGKGRGD